MMQSKNKWGKFKCYCCNYFTLAEPAGNTFQLCPVCFWEDDGIQSDDPSYRGGANRESLTEAKENFLKYGASNMKVKDLVRVPNKYELP
jgi:hypothetical protein